MNKIRITIFALLLLSACSKNDKINPDPTDKPPVDSPAVSLQKDIAALDNEVEAFMKKYNIPGLSIAVTKDEKLVYLKAYGQADIERKEALTTDPGCGLPAFPNQ